MDELFLCKIKTKNATEFYCWTGKNAYMYGEEIIPHHAVHIPRMLDALFFFYIE